MRTGPLAFALLLVTGCGFEGGSSDTPDAAPDVDLVPRATWHQDIAPILAKHCVSCHHEGGIGPFSLENYETSSSLAPVLLENIEAGIMPPWSAISADDCEPRHSWQDDPRLAPEDIEKLRLWIEDGVAEGDLATAAPVPERVEYDLQGKNYQVAPAAAFTPSGTRDQLICLVIDPGIDALTWLTGLQFNPGNIETDHHAVLSVVPAAGIATMNELAGPDGVWDCAGGLSIPGSYPLGVWVPGQAPTETPNESAIPIGAETMMVLQMHYHPTGNDHAPDLTTIDLRIQAQAPERMFFFTVFGNAFEAPNLLPGPNDEGGTQFRVPAGIQDHIERMNFTLDFNDSPRLPVTAMFPHMHYVGTDMKVTIERAAPPEGEPAQECLVNMPRWDFDWQQTYFYDAAYEDLPTIGTGDTIKIECGYDNSPRNPGVLRMMEDEGLANPIDVGLGEQTTDEMCLIIMGVLVDIP